jgi:hypothetical protein
MAMFGNRIKLDDELFEKVRKCAEMLGYASPEEFAAHVLEKEVTRHLNPEQRDPEEEIKKRLQGLGYIE